MSLVFFSSILLTLVGIYFIGRNAEVFGLIDKTSIRKRHKGKALLVGGISIYISVLIISLIFVDIDSFSYKVIILCSVVVLTGIIDDINDISAKLRILIQILVSSVIVYLLDIKITSLGKLLSTEELMVGEYSELLTIFAIVAGINAINFIDGIDGLATSLALIIFILLLILKLKFDNHEGVIFLVGVIGSCATFLFYNLSGFQNQKIFLGDSGSMLIGTLISVFLIESSQGTTQVFSPVSALWFLAIPLIDSLYVIVRRATNGVFPFKADNLHIHYRLLDIGFSTKTILIILSLTSLILSIIALFIDIYLGYENLSFMIFMFLIGIYFFFGYLYRPNAN